MPTILAATSDVATDIAVDDSKGKGGYSNGIYIVGAFPPPVHGMAMLNAAMCDHLRSRGCVPVVLDLSPASLSRGWINRLGRIRKVARSLFRYLGAVRSAPRTTLYAGLSGGWGQWYELLFVLIARLHGARIFLHHHSFAYVDRKQLVTSLLVRAAGLSATHVVGCERQAIKLRHFYPTVSITRVVSNTAIIWRDQSSKARIRERLRRIGFLSNISREKGISEFLAVTEQLEREKSGIEAAIAGPFEDRAAEAEVRSALARLSNLTYAGPRYGPEKAGFWASIDVLVFPSKYANETAPLAVYEALHQAIPVIVWRRGCLSDMVLAESGLVIDRDHGFAAAAVECLLRWQRDPVAFSRASVCAANDFVRQHRESISQLESLLDEIRLTA